MSKPNDKLSDEISEVKKSLKRKREELKEAIAMKIFGGKGDQASLTNEESTYLGYLLEENSNFLSEAIDSCPFIVGMLIIDVDKISEEHIKLLLSQLAYTNEESLLSLDFISSAENAPKPNIGSVFSAMLNSNKTLRKLTIESDLIAGQTEPN